MFNEAKKQFSQKSYLVLTLNLKDDTGRNYIHRYTFNAENISQGILLDMNSHLLGNPNSGYAHDQFPAYVEQSRSISEDLFWGSSTYDWSLNAIDDNYSYSNEIINLSKSVRDLIDINGESTVTSNQNGIVELVAGLAIEVNENVTIEPNSELRVENQFTKCSSLLYPTADITKVTAACNDPEYIARARPFSKAGSIETTILKNNEEIVVSFFPNPAATQITVNVENLLEETQATISILDLQGRSIYNQQVVFDLYSSGVVLPVSNLPSGIYILQVEQKTGQIHREKLIIQK
jgi:hypothetical protein